MSLKNAIESLGGRQVGIRDERSDWYAKFELNNDVFGVKSIGDTFQVQRA